MIEPVAMIYAYTLLCLQVAAFPDAQVLQTQVLAERSRIERGVVEFDSTLTIGDRKQSTSYRITFDGTKVRNDVEQDLSAIDSTGESAATRTLHKYVFTDDDVLWLADLAVPNERSIAAAKCDIRTPAGLRNAKGYSVYRLDPRVIGMVPFDHKTLHNYGPEEILARPDHRNLTISPDVVLGPGVWKIEYERLDGAAVAVWIDADRGPSVVKASLSLHHNGKRLTDTIENEITKYPSGEIWFPQRVHHSRTADGVVTSRSDIEVKMAEFNQPIDDEVFTLAGMDIPRGRMVFETPTTEAGTRYWNGEMLVPYQAAVPQPKPQPVAAPVTNQRTIWIVALNFCLLAIICGIAWWKKRKGRLRSQTPLP